MSRDAVHVAASAFLLVALVLIVIGVNAGMAAMWYAGLAATVIGMGFALATRWVAGEADGGDGERTETRASTGADAPDGDGEATKAGGE